MDKRIIAAILVSIMIFVLGCAVQQQAPEPLPAEQPAEEVPAEEPAEPEPATTKTTKTTTTKTAEPAEEQPAEDTSGYNFDSLPMDQQRKIKYVRKLMDEARATEENYFFQKTVTPGEIVNAARMSWKGDKQAFIEYRRKAVRWDIVANILGMSGRKPTYNILLKNASYQAITAKNDERIMQQADELFGK